MLPPLLKIVSLAGLIVTALAAAPLSLKNTLRWDKASGRVAADIEDLSLQKVLPKIAAQSGWEIFVEPSLDKNVSVKFPATSSGEALKLILGDLNFALVPMGGKQKLYIYRDSLAAATLAVAGRPTNWLSKEILLTLDPDKRLNPDALAAELGAKIVGRSDELSTYRLEFQSDQAAEAARQKLAVRDDVAATDNFEYQRPGGGQGAETATGPAFSLDSKPVTDNQTIRVALIDTALQPLEGKMKDFLLESMHVAGAPNYDPANPMHGTSMAQTILNSLALASKDATSVPVKIQPVDVYGSSATTTTFEVSRGLHAAIQSNPHFINMSLGGAGESPLMDAMLEVARQKQIAVFASAGNSPTTDPTFPAASPYALAVTAADWRGNIAPYANRGEFVDLKAPGNAVVRFNGQTFHSTGTSTSTAFVTGQAAAYRAQGMSYEQALQTVLQRFNVNAPPARK